MPYLKWELARSRHARKRAVERYNIVLSHDDIVVIVDRIENFLQKGMLSEQTGVKRLKGQDRGFPPTVRTAVLYEGQWLPVIYVPSMRIIKTVLPPNELPKILRNVAAL